MTEHHIPLCAEIDRLRARVKELEDERDADRRREYGYSQETVDALTAERDSLKHLYDKALGDLVKDSQRISELEAENTRLRMLRDAAESRAQGLEVERDADRRREYGYSQQTVDALTVERDKLEEENQRLMDEIRDLEWKIYRPLKEGEMTQEGDQVLGPEEDAKWVPVTGNHTLTPSALYPPHCHYRRLIVDEIKKEMEGDYFYRKCVAGKESARSKRIKKLEAENKRLRHLLHKCFMSGVFFSSDLVDEVKQALKEASHELA
jgi:hypothetical protein